MNKYERVAGLISMYACSGLAGWHADSWALGLSVFFGLVYFGLVHGAYR